MVREGGRRERKRARTYVREDCQALEVALSLGRRVVHKVRMGRQPRGNSDKCGDEGTPLNRDRGTRPQGTPRAGLRRRQSHHTPSSHTRNPARTC